MIQRMLTSLSDKIQKKKLSIRFIMGVDDVVAGTTALIHVGWNRVAQCGPENVY